MGQQLRGACSSLGGLQKHERPSQHTGTFKASVHIPFTNIPKEVTWPSPKSDKSVYSIPGERGAIASYTTLQSLCVRKWVCLGDGQSRGGVFAYRRSIKQIVPRHKDGSCLRKSYTCVFPNSTYWLLLGLSLCVRAMWSLVGWIVMESMSRVKAFLRTAELAQDNWSSPLGKQSRSTCPHSQSTHPFQRYFLNRCS